jgi:hypothetical protein
MDMAPTGRSNVRKVCLWTLVAHGVTVLVVLLTVTGCERSQEPRQSAALSAEDTEPVLHVREAPPESPSYDGTGSRTFMGYECTQDCSGHEAGYRWAEDHGIDDPYDCGGNSQSFIEGCRAYAGERGSADDDKTDD